LTWDDEQREEGQEPDEQAPPEEPGAEEEPAPPEETPGPEVEGAEQLDAAAEAGAEQPEEEAPKEEAPQERPRPKGRGKKDGGKADEVIPGEHLEPDLVLEEEEQRAAEGEFGEFAAPEAELAEAPEVPPAEPETEEPPEPEPVAREPLDLASDARYQATGKRKSAIARVVLKPGDGTYTINGRPLVDALPRVKLQRMARQPLEAAGYQTRLDVMARIRGGGVSAQAGALRHGVARALVEADPSLRVELKRRGFLTRDPRVKERKKAGLKKARKRPQFSKR
jgi:small subunit ribosomal protein S9